MKLHQCLIFQSFYLPRLPKTQRTAKSDPEIARVNEPLEISDELIIILIKGYQSMNL